MAEDGLMMGVFLFFAIITLNSIYDSSFKTLVKEYGSNSPYYCSNQELPLLDRIITSGVVVFFLTRFLITDGPWTIDFNHKYGNLL